MTRVTTAPRPPQQRTAAGISAAHQDEVREAEQAEVFAGPAATAKPAEPDRVIIGPWALVPLT